MADFVRADAKGLKDLRKAFRSVNLQRSLSAANKRVVNQVVVPEARSLMSRPVPSLAGSSTRLGTRGLATIKGSASQTSARIQAGSNSVPYYAGQDFGSSGKYRQFPRAQKGGRGLYKAIENTHERMIAVWMDEIAKETRAAFPD